MINIYELIEWFITSSVLILAVMVIRFCTKNRLSPMVRYSLWLIVLLRLLIPFNPLESIFSVMNVAEAQIDSSETIRSVIDVTYHTGPRFYYDSNNILQYQAPETSGRYIFYGIILYGIFVLAERTIYTNWKFWRTLKLKRQLVSDPKDPARPRIYTMEGLASPCLFGILHPSIYITEVAASDPKTREHAIAHEQAHYRHGDHIWSLLRLIVLALHWYNPLVWLACSLSKQDSEQAADAAAIRSLGEQERLSYGQTLISLVQQSVTPRSVLSCSTTMVTGMISSKRTLRKRIVTLARNQRTTRLAAGIASTLMLIVSICTFTGAKDSDWTDPPTPYYISESDSAQDALSYELEVIQKL